MVGIKSTGKDYELTEEEGRQRVMDDFLQQP